MTRDELRAEIRRLYTDHSASQIANMLGLSRGIVSGLIQRMGISKAKPTPTAAEVETALAQMHQLSVITGSKKSAALAMGYSEDYVRTVTTGNYDPGPKAILAVSKALAEATATEPPEISLELPLSANLISAAQRLARMLNAEELDRPIARAQAKAALRRLSHGLLNAAQSAKAMEQSMSDNMPPIRAHVNVW